MMVGNRRTLAVFVGRPTQEGCCERFPDTNEGLRKVRQTIHNAVCMDRKRSAGGDPSACDQRQIHKGR
jgi:hypothetical protein